MFTATENHSTVTVTPTLEGFGRGRAIAFINARASNISCVIRRGCLVEEGRRRGRRGCDEGSHFDVVDDLGWL